MPRSRCSSTRTEVPTSLGWSRCIGRSSSPQWLADQGFAVLVADGRGTPGRGIAWEHAVYRDLAGPVLEDQVDALHAAADRFGFLDLDKVGIRGWSFGGYLAALAVLRRPDVFHAAVAGAPDAEQVLYDTAYTERYLGLPQEEPEVYRDELADRRRAEPPEAAPPHPRPRRRQRLRGEHAPALARAHRGGASPLRASRCRASRT